jgi:hypothetical protein
MAMAGRRKYITVEDCKETREQILHELKTIKKAIIGDDLRGGMVAQVNNNSNQLAQLQEDFNDFVNGREKEKKQSAELSNKWKLTIAGAILAAVSAAISSVIDVILH